MLSKCTSTKVVFVSTRFPTLLSSSDRPLYPFSCPRFTVNPLTGPVFLELTKRLPQTLLCVREEPTLSGRLAEWSSRRRWCCINGFGKGSDGSRWWVPGRLRVSVLACIAGSAGLTFCSLRRGSGIFRAPADGCLPLIPSGASRAFSGKQKNNRISGD